MLLPDDFDQLLARAVQLFWASRKVRANSQGGTRGNVISGKNLDGFLKVVRRVARHSGLPEQSVFTTGRSNLTLPGYYRPTKSWDVVIVHDHRLLAVLEFKSQVGSFGNNFNNRAEEVLGSAADLWMAHTQRAYHPSNHTQHEGTRPADPRAPFLGYLMVLEDSPGSTQAVASHSPHYKVFPEFDRASYAQHYRILCEKLMEQNLYGAASLMLSPQTDGSTPSTWRTLSPATDVRNLFTQLAARLVAALET